MIAAYPFVSAQPVEAARNSQERLVTIYDGTIAQTVATTAATVQEVLDRTGFKVGPHDSVDPGVNASLISTDYKINIHRARPVTIVDGAIRKEIMSPYQSPHDIAQSAGITTYAEDKLDVTRLDDFVNEGIGLKLTIERSVPVTMVVHGKKFATRTRTGTIAQLMTEKKIAGDASVKVWPAASTPITAGLTIAVFKDGDQNLVEEDVPFATQRVQDASKEVGYRTIKEHGAPGRKLVMYTLETKNGKQVRNVLQSIALSEPRTQVEVIGVKRTGFGGSLDDAMARLRACEAGGNYNRNSGNGYYGAYQYNISTWANYGGYALPSDAPAAVQDQKAAETYKRRGWQPWPGCTVKLGLQDVYR